MIHSILSSRLLGVVKFHTHNSRLVIEVLDIKEVDENTIKKGYIMDKIKIYLVDDLAAVREEVSSDRASSL